MITAMIMVMIGANPLLVFIIQNIAKSFDKSNKRNRALDHS